MNEHGKINYVEFPASNLQATKDFFSKAFGWVFEVFGPEYIAFSNRGLDGGFFKSDKKSSSENGAALMVFYSSDIETSLSQIENAGGIINKPIFAFPGGRRFHFIEPSGNEMAVWSDIGL